MKLHDLKPAEGSRRAKKRVGRGDRGKGGKTAGRGTKGTGARSTVPVGFEGGQMPLKRRQPKLPGFTVPSKVRRRDVEFAIVNVSRLETSFDAGEEVTAAALRERGLIGRRPQPVKILGDGELTKALTVRVDKVSASAQEKIVGAGGNVEETAEVV